ncbi:MAG: FAD-binding oxidoreductase [Oscillospiraceae bacterium]
MAKSYLHLITDNVEEYLRDESRTVGSAESISFPRSEEDVRGILRELGGKTPVTVQGARTGLAAGAVPFGGHILNLTRLNRVLGLRENLDGEFSVILQPGVALSVLRKCIADKKFDTEGWDAESLCIYEIFKEAPRKFFPPDPTEVSATVGGMVSCNASGAKSFRYGATRGYVKALRVVLTDGDVIALRRGENFADGRTLTLMTEGGRLIKLRLPSYNVPATKSASGYYIKDDMDAIDLFIGMDGTLGVITEIEVSLLPLSHVIWGAMFFFKDEASCIDFVIRARKSGSGKIAALEYFDSNVLEILREQRRTNPSFSRLPLPSDEFSFSIYAELHCNSEEEAARELFALGECMEASGGSERDTWVSRTALEYNALIGFRHAAPECVNMIIDRRKKEHPSITKLGTDLSVPDEHLAEIMAMYHAMLAERNLQYAIWGHIGSNHVHVNIIPQDENDYKEGKALYNIWAKRIVKMGGAVSAEHGIGKIKADQFRMMYEPVHFREMRRLKLALDPNGIFGRGTIFRWEDDDE